MVVRFMVKFVGPVGDRHGLASTIVEVDEDESGVDYENLSDQIVGYLKGVGFGSRRLRVDAIVNGEEGSGSIYQGDRRIGTCRLIRREVTADA